MRKFILATAAAAIAAIAGAFWMIPSSAFKASAGAFVLPQNENGTAFEAAETFLRHLRKGELTQAYAMAAPALAAKITVADFRKEVGIFQRVGMESVSWKTTRSAHKFMTVDPEKGFRWNVYESEFTGDLKSRGGNVTLRFAWINDSGKWQVQAFRWESTPVQTSQAR